ncbi:MAG: fumarylacetoacetate hydrolase family protein [Planctomycetia bacterium]|nr:fumarylacetoacetate hydrolase family protein [Planctomycetia bacterium]
MGATDTLGALAAREAAPDGIDGIRLCRYVPAPRNARPEDRARAALYLEDHLIDLRGLAAATKFPLPEGAGDDLLDYLPPSGMAAKALATLVERYQALPEAERRRLKQPVSSVRLLVPIPEPKKAILLAGNYAAHIVEGGMEAPERKETFPYFFWKPPSTTLTNHGDPIRIPAVSPDHVDWEIELGVVIGKQCRNVAEKEALNHVAGYSVCNDVSDRKFTLNPQRKKRDMDGFFDWLHGKWHDTFLPMGPCIRSAASTPDPQKLGMKLRVNGKTMQDASTAQMIFPVAAIVSTLSSFMTLEPGDIIVTGTPAGVGAGRIPPVYLKKGDVVEAEIEGIGILRNPVA